jgi:hypothetical protein
MTTPLTSFAFAPNKLAQLINPLFWLPSGTGQIGFINISGNASSKPAVEADIIENVATYGRQLGRMSDLLEALLKHVDSARWTGEDAAALRAFQDMTAAIAAVKAGHLAPTQANVDDLIAGVKALRATNLPEFERLKAHIGAELLEVEPARRPRRKRRTNKE